MNNINKRLEILESKIQPESGTPVTAAGDCVSAATIFEAAMLAMELGIAIKAIAGGEDES